MRLFVASVLPSAERARCDALVKDLAVRSQGRVRAIPRDTAHITHAFLGEVRDLGPERLADDITRAVEGQRAIAITLGPPRLLRTGRVPRLVFAPIDDGAEAIAALSRSIVLVLRAHAPFANLPFPKAPHVTLARFRRDAGSADARHVEDVLAQPDVRITSHAKIDSVELMSSVLTGPAPVYEVLTLFRLEGLKA